VMALLILTSPHSVQSVRALFVRPAYLLFPPSLAYIQYLPQLGRIPTRSCSSLFVGVTTHRKTPGLLAMVMLLFFLLACLALSREKQQGRPVPRGSLLIRGILIVQGGYLLFLCQSVTSMLCSMLGAVLFWATGRLLKLARPALMVTGAFAFVA